MEMKELLSKPDKPGCWWLWFSISPPLKQIYYVEEHKDKLMASNGVFFWDFSDLDADCLGWERVSTDHNVGEK
jgi:hypothetical protein